MLTTGERLTIARERAGIGVGEFAAKVKPNPVHRNTVSRWEDRHREPHMDTIRLYVELCGNTTVEWLVAEVGDPPSFVTLGYLSEQLALPLDRSAAWGAARSRSVTGPGLVTGFPELLAG